MNMAPVLNALLFIGLVSLVVLIIRIRNVDKRLKATENFIRSLIAQAKSAPAPTDPALHRAWFDRYNELADGPKKAAYRNRLIAIGILDQDANVIREP